MTGRAHTRETVASAAQYALLGGFSAVAAGISAQGLTGFARDNMGLRGAWPYLLFLALDGAAGVCAVLLTRRAARAESALAPRLAVWCLVAASSSFNWTHAPHHPGAPGAFGLMPVIAAVLFEFTLHELRQRSAGRADRRLTALRWNHVATLRGCISSPVIRAVVCISSPSAPVIHGYSVAWIFLNARSSLRDDRHRPPTASQLPGFAARTQDLMTLPGRMACRCRWMSCGRVSARPQLPAPSCKCRRLGHD
jgi:hypothetical protein